MPNRHVWQADIKSYRKAPGRKNTIHLHRARAEAALGHALPAKAIVHHADGTRSDTGPLVICPNQAYHMELHRKMRIQQAGGNPWTQRICKICGLQPVTAFRPSLRFCYCRECERKRHNIYYQTHPAYRKRACARAAARRRAA